jgi:hypothetical protein
VDVRLLSILIPLCLLTFANVKDTVTAVLITVIGKLQVRQKSALPVEQASVCVKAKVARLYSCDALIIYSFLF